MDMSLLVERNLPWFSGFLAGLAYLLFRSQPLQEQLRDVFSAVVGVAGIGVTLLITAQSILFSSDDKWIIQRAKEAGAYRMLVDYLASAVRWSLVLAVFTAVALAFDLKWNLWWYPYAFAAWLWCAVTTVLATSRVARIFLTIFRSSAGE